jgi:hypothetical protein
MIEYQINPTKRFIFKTVAILLVAAFLWYDISWAGDLYNYNLAHTGQTGRIPPIGLNPEKISKQTKEVTNYDMLSDDRKESISRKLLPTVNEEEQSQQFAPAYIQSQQAKHEDIIRQKQDAEDNWQMPPIKKPKEEELELKKKKGGPEGGGRKSSSEEDAQYDLQDPDTLNVPHTLDDFVNPQNRTQTNRYDITRMNIDSWTAGAVKKTDKNGVDYWIGYDDKGNPDESKRILTVMYVSPGSDQIAQVLAGYRLTKDGTYQPEYRIDYSYSGSDIT